MLYTIARQTLLLSVFGLLSLIFPWHQKWQVHLCFPTHALAAMGPVVLVMGLQPLQFQACQKFT